MARIYGHKWTSINETDDGTWLTGLSDVEPDQVAHGLSILVTDHHDWPPTLPEFRDLCIGYKHVEPDHWQQCRSSTSLLSYKPETRASNETAKTEFKKMKKILGINHEKS